MAKTYEHWSSDLGDAQPVLPFRALRLESPGTFQFIRGDKQYFAVDLPEPYGVLTEVAGDPDVARRTHLLHAAEQADGVTIFDIPEDALTLRAVTLGAGRKLELGDIYRRVGETVGALIARYPIPPLLIDDFAVTKHDGHVLLIPPVRFGEGDQDGETHAAALIDSLPTELPWWSNEAAHAIDEQLRNGMGLGRGQQQ